MTYAAFIVLLIAGERVVSPDMRGPYQTREACEARLVEGRAMVESRPSMKYLEGVSRPSGPELFS